MSELQHLNLSLESGGRVAVLELDHGKANEMGTAQLAEFEQLVDTLSAADGPVALLSFSRRSSTKGTPIFIAGANVTERVGWSDEDVKTHVRKQRRVLAAVRRVPVFHVAVVAGVALGWGTEFLLAADYRIAAPGAAFGLPETGLGIVPGAGGSSELRAHIGVAQTLRLGMTGERIGPEEAARIGLVQEVSDSLESAMTRARALAHAAATRSPTANAHFKRAVLSSIGVELEARTELEARAYEACVDAGEAAIGRKHFADIRAGLRPPWGPRRT